CSQVRWPTLPSCYSQVCASAFSKFLFQSEVKFLSQSEVEAILVRICRDGLTRSCSTCRDIARNRASSATGHYPDHAGGLSNITIHNVQSSLYNARLKSLGGLTLSKTSLTPIERIENAIYLIRG